MTKRVSDTTDEQRRWLWNRVVTGPSAADQPGTVPWYHLFHTWTQWQDDRLTLTNLESGREQSSRPVQRRRCVRCNKSQVNYLPIEY